MATANSRNQFLFLQEESSDGVIPNSSGVATVANGNACRIISLKTDAEQDNIKRPDKTGSLSSTIGIGGRRNASWSASMSLASNGVAGVKPDSDLLWKALFGKASVAVASTSVTYGMDDLSPTLSIWNMRSPNSVSQSVAFGAIANTCRVTLGQDVAQAEFSGEAKWVIDTDQFATAITEAKGGLTAFPVPPSGPITNGNMVVGFTGAVTLDGNVFPGLRTVTVNYNMNRERPKDTYNNYFSDSPAQDERDVTIDFSIYDNDSANMSSLKAKAFDKQPVTLSFGAGLIAGNRWTFVFNNVLLGTPKYDDGQRKFAVSFNASKSNATTGGAKDESTLVIT